MSSLVDRNRELMIERLRGDPRLGGAEVVTAMPLMRVSIFTAVVAGVVGALVSQLVVGQGGLQFLLGMVAGYLAYAAYLLRTMGEPRVIGAMAVLTPEKVILLGSRRAGIAAEYNLADLESLEIRRKGNLLVTGKLGINPIQGESVTFFTTNRNLAAAFVAEFDEIRRQGSSA
jgi:hypothetical protein